jgi:hypothetical protein
MALLRLPIEVAEESLELHAFFQGQFLTKKPEDVPMEHRSMQHR